MKKITSMILLLTLVFTFSVNAFAESGNSFKGSEEQLQGEYFTRYQLNYDELREIDRFQTAYYRSLYDNNPSEIQKWFDYSSNIYVIADVLGVVGRSGVGRVVNGVVELIKWGVKDEKEAIKRAAREGMFATDRAIDNYISVERSRNDIIFAEVEFFVYDDRINGEAIKMIQGGGDIKRFKTTRGWITTSNPFKKKDKLELLNDNPEEL